MLRICLWFLVVCVFFIAEGRILDPRWDPNRELRVLPLEEQLVNLETVSGASRGRVKRSDSMGRQDILDELCEVFNEFRGGHSAHRQYFQREGRLDHMDEDLQDNLDLNLQQRRARTRECCQGEGEDRLWCFESYHIRRIDQYCRDGTPDIPFRHHTQDWHTDRKTRCCIVVGMDRLDCFGNIRPTAASGEEVPQDDLDPAYDASHYTSVDQPISLPQQHGATERVGNRRRPSSPVTRTTVRSQRQRDGRVSPSPTPTRDYCCAAGQVSGVELTANVFRTCYENAVKMVDFLPSPKPSNCEEVFFDCCRRAREGHESDEDRTMGATRGDDEDANDHDDDRERGTTQADQRSSERRRGRSRRIRHEHSRRSGRRRGHRRPGREGRRRSNPL